MSISSRIHHHMRLTGKHSQVILTIRLAKEICNGLNGKVLTMQLMETILKFFLIILILLGTLRIKNYFNSKLLLGFVPNQLTFKPEIKRINSLGLERKQLWFLTTLQNRNLNETGTMASTENSGCQKYFFIFSHWFLDWFVITNYNLMV